MSKQPKFLWAQSSDRVYLTVSLQDAIRFSVDCEPEGVFKFSAVDVNNESCNFILQLYGNISPQGCETKIGSRGIMCCIPKERKGWWKRLLKFKMKAAPYIKNKIDWNRWCDEEGENLRSNSLMRKRRRIDESSPSHLIPGGRENQQGRRLVICSNIFYGAGPVCYTFESISTEELIHHCSMQLEHIKDHLFVWCDKNKSGVFDAVFDPRYISMSFLHANSVIYAVGGFKPFRGWVDPYRNGYFPYPAGLNFWFRCISLSGEVRLLSQMAGEKYSPIITEINGLIYVLSHPPPDYATSFIDRPFEVYYPLSDEWNSLEPPPSSFMEKQSFDLGVGDYGYFVFGHKLYVSTQRYSSCYDVSRDRWETCDILFEPNSFIFLEKDHFSYPDRCGLPFPFMRRAIHFKDNIFLCVLRYAPYMGAFQITDYKTAKRVPFRSTSIPYGKVHDIVDLGDDCFVVFVNPVGRISGYVHDVEEMMMIILKMHLDDGDLTCTVINSLRFSIGQDGSPMQWPIYSFIL